MSSDLWWNPRNRATCRVLSVELADSIRFAHPKPVNVTGFGIPPPPAGNPGMAFIGATAPDNCGRYGEADFSLRGTSVMSRSREAADV